MYKARLSQWGISKNYSDKDYQICCVLNHHRQKSGKRSTAFMIHGHKRSLRDLHKYIKGRKMTEADFLNTALANIDGDHALDSQSEQYSHVRAYTPEPEAENDEPLSSTTAATRGRPADIAANPRAPKPPPTVTTIKTESFTAASVVSGVSGPASCSTAPTSASFAPLSPNQESPASHRTSPRAKASPSFPIAAESQVTPYAQHRHGINYPAKANAGTWASNSSPLSSRGHLVSSPQGTPTSSSLHYNYSAGHESIGSFEDQVRHAGSFYDSSSPEMRCQRLGRDVEHMALQIIDAPPLKSLCGHDDIRAWSLLLGDSSSSEDSMDYEQICPTCHEPTREHFISLPNLELPTQPRSILNTSQDLPESTFSVPASSRAHEHSWKWVARCFAACIYLRRGNDTLSRKSLEDADAEFEKMLGPQQDPKILLALNQTLQILQMHDQGEITRTIMDSTYRMAERVLGPNDPLTIISKWMVYVSNAQMRDCGITSATLYDIHQQFVLRHGYDDPRSIASQYCYGFMLNVEGKLQDAEQVLREVYDISSRALGARHLQSISALTNLNRSLQRQDRIDEAITVLSRAIHDSKDTLGENHPRRLESIRLLALLYKQQGRLDWTERLYWTVLEGRVKMLGKNHAFTQGMKVDLEALLKEMGKWTVERQIRDVETGQLKVAEVESDAQLRMHDTFDWDPNEQWDDTRSDGGDSDGTGSQHAAF